MKKAKTLEVKLRSALRLIWSRSAERRAILKAAMHVDPTSRHHMFVCPVCSVRWVSQMGEVDHIEPLGALELTKITEWVDRLFHSPQRVLCKLCHRVKTTQDRKNMKLRRKNG